MLTHLTIVGVVISWICRQGNVKETVKYLAFGFAVMVGIPQLRKAMPDAPGLDGVLIGEILFILISIFSILMAGFEWRRRLHWILPTDVYRRLLYHLHACPLCIP